MVNWDKIFPTKLMLFLFIISVGSLILAFGQMGDENQEEPKSRFVETNVIDPLNGTWDYDNYEIRYYNNSDEQWRLYVPYENGTTLMHVMMNRKYYRQVPCPQPYEQVYFINTCYDLINKSAENSGGTK